MDTELIIVKKIYQSSRIEPEFLNLLENEGLIQIINIDGNQYIHESKLTELERFACLYYDLSINIEGIDVINNILNKMREMQNELFRLKHHSAMKDIYSEFDTDYYI